MALWLPLGLMAVTVLAVYSQRQASPRATCDKLSADERANLERFLATDPKTILSVGSSQGARKEQVVAGIHAAARELERDGCPDDARRVDRKADEVALLPDQPVIIPKIPGSAGEAPRMMTGDITSGGFLQGNDLAGAYIAPEVRVPATGESPPTAHNVALGTSARLDQAFHQASSPASRPLAMMRTRDRVAIRPNLAAADDQFTVPAGFPVGVLAFGPPACPPGWARVELVHPDHGRLSGFTEATNLVPAAASPQTAPQQARAASPRPQQPQSFQGRTRTRTGAKIHKRPKTAPRPSA
jgi:hypothetical protein